MANTYDWSDWKLTLKGLEAAQDVNKRRIGALQPSSDLGRAVQYAVLELQRYAKSITHIDTSALQASHLGEVYGTRGRIYINPSAINPRGQRPETYGPYEQARGGSHAFYDRTVDERGPGVIDEVGRRIMFAVESA